MRFLVRYRRDPRFLFAVLPLATLVGCSSTQDPVGVGGAPASGPPGTAGVGGKSGGAAGTSAAITSAGAGGSLAVGASGGAPVSIGGGGLAAGGASGSVTTSGGSAGASTGFAGASGGAEASGGSVSDPCASVTCGPGQTCSGGTCTCEKGMVCTDGCFDTQEDKNHCGDCTTKCAADGACVSGKCVNPMCNVDTEVRQGKITTYNLATSLVACHYPTNTLPQYYGAMNTYDWATAGVCGACVEITNTQNSRTLVVQIVDECPDVEPNKQWCFQGSHHIDLNGAAYGALGANNNPAIHWKYVACTVEGNIKYNFDKSSQQYYLQVTPMNIKNRVAKMEAKKGSEWLTLTHTNYNTYEAEMGVGTGDITFRLTDIYNHVVTDTVTMTPGQIVQGNVQFAACP